MTRDLSQLVAQHRSGFAADVVSDVAPLDVSRFPDSCAFEGAAPVVSYEDGIREQEADPWIFWAVVIGVIGGMLLSVAFPMGVV
jgi:hypothetical protein